MVGRTHGNQTKVYLSNGDELRVPKELAKEGNTIGYEQFKAGDEYTDFHGNKQKYVGDFNKFKGAGDISRIAKIQMLVGIED